MVKLPKLYSEMTDADRRAFARHAGRMIQRGLAKHAKQ
jgi:hypothetical protein